VGTTPILAREGEHEGLFFGLQPERVVRWLDANHMCPPDTGGSAMERILLACEPMGRDRYYDTIWEQPVRRMVYGLVHSLSHAAMRVISRLGGLERTSLAEYVFLPLLGTVVYASDGTYKMGHIETLLRSNLAALLDGLETEGVTCLLDPDCIDKTGACAGCLHSPEICCRVFNHGLSRAFLLGGPYPWNHGRGEERLVGYWEIGVS
jgi:hypothetical protein